MATTLRVANAPNDRLRDRAGAWVDLGLTLPIFLVYQVAVVFLGVQNATDMVTGALLRAQRRKQDDLSPRDVRHRRDLRRRLRAARTRSGIPPRKFVQIAIEGVVYAVLMRLVAGYVVGSLFAGRRTIADQGRFVGFVMSLGAGFYEELTFRVVLFGLGAKLLVWLVREADASTSRAPHRRAVSRCARSASWSRGASSAP